MSYDFSLETVILLNEMQECILDLAETIADEISEELGTLNPGTVLVVAIADQLVSNMTRFLTERRPTLAQLAPAQTGMFFDIPDELLPTPLVTDMQLSVPSSNQIRTPF